MNILQSTTSLLKRTRSIFFDPTRDWIMLLIIALLALAGIIVWNVWLFNTVVNGGTIGSVATSSPPILNQAVLDSVRTIFTDRATEEEKYLSDTYHFADPSQSQTPSQP